MTARRDVLQVRRVGSHVCGRIHPPCSGFVHYAIVMLGSQRHEPRGLRYPQFGVPRPFVTVLYEENFC
jgi:hypothetical protein